MKTNRNRYTDLLCKIDHRPNSRRAARAYFRVQRYICYRNIKAGWEKQADICTSIFSDEEIAKIMRVLTKIRIIDADIKHHRKRDDAEDFSPRNSVGRVGNF